MTDQKTSRLGQRELVVTYAASDDHLYALRRRLPDWLVSLAPDSSEDRGALVGGAEYLLAWRWAREIPKETAFERLRFVQFLSSGVDHIDVNTLPGTAVVASNAGAYATAMAEHAMGLTLALAKNLKPAEAGLRVGRFLQSTSANTLLAGKTALLLGLGGVGQGYATLARCFGMRVIGINRSGRSDLPLEACGKLADFPAMLPEADVLLIALPLTRETRGLVRAQELQQMKRTAILVNVARAAIVAEGDLYRHLAREPSFRAGLDVWWAEPTEGDTFTSRYSFTSLPNFVGTPHVSARVEDGLLAGVDYAARNIASFAATGKAANVVKDADQSLCATAQRNTPKSP